MKWAVDVFCCVLKEEEYNNERWSKETIIYCRNNNAGFINDTITSTKEEDAMPIAYHGFTIFLLSVAYYIGKSNNILSNNEREIESVIEKGILWWKNIVCSDGSAAYSGRSGYQLFNYGVNAYLQALIESEDVLYTLQYIGKLKMRGGSIVVLLIFLITVCVLVLRLILM